MGTFKLLKYVENPSNYYDNEPNQVINSSISLSDIQQLDGNESLNCTLKQGFPTNDVNRIPVIVSNREPYISAIENRKPVRHTIRRNNIVLQSLELPVVMNINPRSIYNKCEEFSVLVEQYEADLICMSESWDRENYRLDQVIQIENYRVISNVKQRDFRGGKPAIIVNEEKFIVRPLCPEPITVPIGVEAVWCLLIPKNRTSTSKVKYIAVCAIYYRGPKSTKKAELFDHIADTYNYLSALYPSGLHFIIAGDTNRLSLTPILNLSPNLIQVVKVPTRLNPQAILDPIITTLSKFYNPPVTKPPIQNDSNKTGKPSDHLVVLMKPLSSSLEVEPRKYKTVEFRPLPESGIIGMKNWIENYDWKDVFICEGANEKAEKLQNIMLEKLEHFFPKKSFKVCSEDKAWVTKEVKKFDRARKREFCKRGKSEKWVKIDQAYQEKCRNEKEKYFSNIVQDLKSSNVGQWYSKIKRMSEQEKENPSNILVEEISEHSNCQQAELIADHYAQISNQYKPLEKDDLPQEYVNSKVLPPYIPPFRVNRIIKTMNKKCATVLDDIPMKLVQIFSYELSNPLAHIINKCLLEGIHPSIYKTEVVTPAPKVYPPQKIKDLRKIAGLKNFSKIIEKTVAQFIVQDMRPKRDKAQYGNEKGLSTQHYLIRLLHNALAATDRNSKSEKFAVIISLIDWSQAFDRQSHQLGIKSFVDNGVRPSLIPYLISYFQDRKMVVKWNGELSSIKSLNGGGPQGATLGLLEYLSQTNNNTDFLDVKEKFKFIDDLSILEIINLVMIGVSSYNFKAHVASDIGDHGQYIPADHLKTKTHLERISTWTEDNLMKLNTSKSKYMVLNFTNDWKFSTRLSLEDKNLEQVSETKLLGVWITDDLKWSKNTTDLVKNAYKRMTILRKLNEFAVPVEELVNIYILFIRSKLEQSAVVWHSSITRGEEIELERVQKVALRLILKEDYESYQNALLMTNLESLKSRRKTLCLRFAKKCTKSEHSQDMFPVNTKQHHEKYHVTFAETDRFKYSAIPYMQRLLNSTKS